MNILRWDNVRLGTLRTIWVLSNIAVGRLLGIIRLGTHLTWWVSEQKIYASMISAAETSTVKTEKIHE